MLSIVIPTYNEEKHIKDLLVRLRPQLESGDEVVIVDSYSSDRTAEIARSFGAKVVFQPKKGNGLARTDGAKEARNDIVVFMDADCIPSEDFASRIRRHFRSDHIVAVGGLDLYHTDSGIRKFVYDTFSKSIFYSARVTHAMTGKYWLASNNCAFRRDVFLRAGGYRSVICEDTDLTRRLPPSKNVVYDSNLKISLSDRRFRKDGFSKTISLWIRSNLAVMMGKGYDSSGYKKDY